MDEHRRSPRQRVLKAGKILYGGGSIAIDCTIRNLSETGARLQVPTSVAIPDQFDSWKRRAENGAPPQSCGARAN